MGLRALGTALRDRGEGGALRAAVAVSAWMLPEPAIAAEHSPAAAVMAMAVIDPDDNGVLDRRSHDVQIAVAVDIPGDRADRSAVRQGDAGQIRRREQRLVDACFGRVSGLTRNGPPMCERNDRTQEGGQKTDQAGTMPAHRQHATTRRD